jgi:Domain of unknown function (DUF4386)
MEATPEQRTYARLAGICFLANYVLQGVGDTITLTSRASASFAETARWAAESALLYRVALVQVGAAWIAIGILAFALYAVLEPVNKRLAQLALVLRLGASFVGAASLMFRVAQARLYQASEPAGLFTTEQLRELVAVSQRAASAGFTVAMMFLGAGSTLFFQLFLRSRYLPGALARFGIFASALLVAVAVGMFVFPERTNVLKLFGAPLFLAEVATAIWLLFKGLQPRTAAEARA